MPVYTATSSPQVIQGDSFTLFDGTETPSAGLKSIAFERKQYGSLNPSPSVFTVSFTNAPNATVLIEASNDLTEANFQTVGGPITTQHGYYSDIGSFRYYRANLSAYVGGLMPTVIVQR